MNMATRFLSPYRKGCACSPEAAKLIARLSGDEFAILIAGQQSPLTAEQLAARLSWSFANTALPLKSRSQLIGVSIGGAIFPADGQTAEELLANGHLALCKAKSISRGEYVFFEREIRDELEARFVLEAELAAAIRNSEFELHYQPQFNLAEQRLVGAEALIRWRHPERGLLFPGSFMPVVNTSPISDDVAAWVMAEACRQGRKWQDMGHAIRMAVNLSPSQFRSNGLVQQVKDVIAATGFLAEAAGTRGHGRYPVENDDLALRRLSAGSGTRNSDRVRRFRHRLWQLQPSQEISAQQAQDRQVVRVRTVQEPR